ncbi:hypothetical protein IV203_008757 [Nitzschia inconspicua]|uniref:Uncharacterized protein n=1 Tax=Nitzschia inconspicua TaxID=303405 RepID=A0A9K3PPQ8_9STRA|nr:hypothetical protein IV203_008757 [Nitzschia inconspicua]
MLKQPLEVANKNYKQADEWAGKLTSQLEKERSTNQRVASMKFDSVSRDEEKVRPKSHCHQIMFNQLQDYVVYYIQRNCATSHKTKPNPRQ